MVKKNGADESEPRWTVMVFMGADNPTSEVDLSEEAEKDIHEMEEAYQTMVRAFKKKQIASMSHLNIVVQVNGKTSARRQHIGKPAVDVDQGERDATDGKALIAFMRWALDAARHRPDDYTMLVLWGHAYDFAIGRTDTRGGIDALDFAELADVLKVVQEDMRRTFELDEAPKLDVVAFDACALATIEMAVQLHPFADYLLASQIDIPLPGWPYHRILDRLAVPFGRLMGPAEFGSYTVRRFCQHYRAQPRDAEDPEQGVVSLSLLDLGRAQTAQQLTEQLARRLAVAMDNDSDERELVSDLFCWSQTSAEDPFVDVADLCINLLRYSGDAAVRDAAEDLGDFLVSAAPVVPGESVTGGGRPFVVEHGGNACQTAKLHGVSLYAPHVSALEHESADPFYDKFVFARESLWKNLVYALDRPNSPVSK